MVDKSETPFGEADRRALSLLQTLGFQPRCILDIGASNGGWTRRVAAPVFPLARFHMFEPLAGIAPSYETGLNETLESEFECAVHRIALGASCGTAKIGVTSDFFGSSVLLDNSSPAHTAAAEVPRFTLDVAVKRFDIPQPQLVKMDTQGSELEILTGAVDTLREVEVLLVESWLVRGYGEKTPLLPELIGWLAHRHFYLFDFLGGYRGEDGVLLAQDVLFVRNGSVCAGAWNRAI